MGNENIEVKNLEGLKDLDSFKEGDTVKMEIGGNTSLKVCYRPLKGVSYPNGKLKFLNPASMTEDVVISLYVPRESVLVKDNMIKVINPKDITLMLSYRNDPLDSGMSYMNKVDTIRKAGF